MALRPEERIMGQEIQDGRFITFSINGESYAIEVLKIQEVIYIPEITEVPGAPGSVVGVVNLRGILLTIVDTAIEFGLQRPVGADYTRIVVVVLGEDERVGLMVDGVSEVITLPLDQRESLPTLDSSRLGQYARYIVHHESKPVTLLEMDRIVDSVQWG